MEKIHGESFDFIFFCEVGVLVALIFKVVLFSKGNPCLGSLLVEQLTMAKERMTYSIPSYKCLSP
jgi:hypothetical protein